jgi:hypothetical protein
VVSALKGMASAVPQAPLNQAALAAEGCFFQTRPPNSLDFNFKTGDPIPKALHL